MRSEDCVGVTRNLTQSPNGEQTGGGTKKITIPSDLRFHSQALSVNVGNPCELPVAKIRRSWRAKPLRVSATTLKFRVPSEPLAGRQRERELENFNFNLSGSDPIVANRAGVILTYGILLSTKKCANAQKIL
jgi:hypothetical protein